VLLNFYNEFTNYLLKRICIPRIGTLIVAIFLLELYLSIYVSVKEVTTHFFLIVLLVVTFRIWDDFSDRKYDYKFHPERLPGAGNPQNISFYKMIIMGLLFFNTLLILLLLNTMKFVIFGAMLLLFSVIYLKEKWSFHSRLLRNQIILLKYPAILYLGSQSTETYRLIISSLLVYLFISWYDISSATHRSTSNRTWFFTSILLIFELSKNFDHGRIL